MPFIEIVRGIQLDLSDRTCSRIKTLTQAVRAVMKIASVPLVNVDKHLDRLEARVTKRHYYSLMYIEDFRTGFSWLRWCESDEYHHPLGGGKRLEESLYIRRIASGAAFKRIAAMLIEAKSGRGTYFVVASDCTARRRQAKADGFSRLIWAVKFSVRGDPLKF